MVKIIPAALAGAVVYFIWQMSAWMFLPIHGPTVGPLPDETPVRELLIEQNVETGVYVVPYGTKEAMMDAESEYMKRHESGPLVAIYFQKEGAAPMSPKVLGIGLLTDILGCSIVATLLWCALGGCCMAKYWGRVGFITGFGVFLALMGHFAYYNWMHFPIDYTAMFMVDAIVGWFLAGLAIAAIIRPGKVQCTIENIENKPTENKSVESSHAD